MTIRESLSFLAGFVRQPSKVGAVAASSPALVQVMVDWFEWTSAKGIVEYGPGTGVFTEAILRSMHPEARFFAIEQSEQMVRATKQRCPNATVYHGSAVDVADYCQKQNLSQVDAIICGLPWASFSGSLQDQLMTEMLQVLRPGGQFATFAYLQGLLLPAGRRFAGKLQQSFASVEKSEVVWRNLPPALVYRCRV
ncbi:MAG: methyltransferase domain-containing protein [Planctomycetota bacterium]